MASPQVLALLKKRREKTVDLGDGRKVKFLRPLETSYGKMLKTDPTDPTKATWAVGLDQVKECVFDWEGFTEASLLGADIGSADIVPFDKELFDEVVSDKVDWVAKVATAILESVVQMLEQKAAAEKNSVPA